MADYSNDDYYELSLASIHRAQGLASGETLELNVNLCTYLCQELLVTERFLIGNFDKLRRILHFGVDDNRRVALLKLYAVVKQAENLVQQCCQNEDPSWPPWLERALTLREIKEDVFDILLHLRWWTSVLDIVIVSTTGTSYSPMSEITFSKTGLSRGDRDFELECLKLADKFFGDNLTSITNELVDLALKDKELILDKLVEFQRSYTGEPVTGEHYALSVQVQSLLTGREAANSLPQLNEYEYQHRGYLGQGVSGVVHAVRWCGYDCVLKQCLINLKHPDERSEAKSLKKFHHPHIVKFFRHWEAVPAGKDPDEFPAQSHIVMERMPMDLGDHMAALLTKKRKASLLTKRKLEQTPEVPFLEPVAIDMQLQMAKVVWHMHSKNVIHRDLKPGNVLVRPVTEDAVPELSALGYLQVKLGDFGIARENILSSHAGYLSKKQGTTVYRAPEFSSDEYISGENKNYPHKADSWSFSMMCSEILTGQRPFSDIKVKDLEVHIKEGGRPDLPQDCPDYWKFCLESCWKFEPKERPSFSDIWRMLRLAELRCLGLIQQNYDFMFTFKDHKGRVVKLSTDSPRPRQKSPDAPVSLQPQRSPAILLPLSPVGPQPNRQAPVRQSNSAWKEAFSSVMSILKFKFVRRSVSEGLGTHLQSPHQNPFGYFVNQIWPLDSTSDWKLDVILFEGNVGGRRALSCRDTWLQRGKPNVFWPGEWLAQDLHEDIRVLVIEYTISLEGSGLEEVVTDLKKFLIFSDRWNQEHTWQRPIVLVGHSLGCTVIEALVVDLNRTARRFDQNLMHEYDRKHAETSRAFLNSLAGCFFYAPPCRGLDQSADVLKYVFGGLIFSEELFKDLYSGSPMLKKLSEDFKHFVQTQNASQSRQIRLMALIEGHHTRGRFVVPKEVVPEFEHVALADSNHTEVCKPVNRNHDSYQMLVKFLKEYGIVCFI